MNEEPAYNSHFTFSFTSENQCSSSDFGHKLLSIRQKIEHKNVKIANINVFTLARQSSSKAEKKNCLP